MKAIKTTYLGPTNTLPSRIKASAEGVTSKTYSSDAGHEAAARAFCVFHDWSTNLVSGQLDADTWVHCFDTARAPRVVNPPVPRTDSQKIQAYLDYTNNFCTAQGFAAHYGLTEEQGILLIRDGRNLHEASCKPKPRVFTVVSVSSNVNSFGYKGVLVLTEDGTGFECIGDFTTFEAACAVAEKLGGVA